MVSVLVVDDDVSIVRLVDLVLRSEQIEVCPAFNGEQGLSVLQNSPEPPDLILLDLAMPGMDGKEFFQFARAGGYAGPIIVCSSWGAAVAKRELGAQGAIEKPFDPEDLLEVVQAQLSC